MRRETPTDQRAIFDVHAAAFARTDDAVPSEAQLVDDLRAAGDIVDPLSVVAELNGQVVGYVVCSDAHIDGYAVLGLGPLGVAPHYQRRGVGLALMHAVIAAADALDHPAVVLLGNPRYYERFGFQLAQPLGILPTNPSWTPHFQIRPLTAWPGEVRGTFHYAPAFDET